MENLKEDLQDGLERSANFMQVVDKTEKQPEFEVATTSNEPLSSEDLQKSINDAINNPKVKEYALINAKYLEDKFRKNWFTLDQVLKKTNMKKLEPTIDILNILCMMGFAYRKEQEGQVKYKITITPENKLILLQEELLEAEQRVTEIKGYINDISNNTGN